jgi:hypothetical protein
VDAVAGGYPIGPRSDDQRGPVPDLVTSASPAMLAWTNTSSPPNSSWRRDSRSHPHPDFWWAAAPEDPPRELESDLAPRGQLVVMRPRRVPGIRSCPPRAIRGNAAPPGRRDAQAKGQARSELGRTRASSMIGLASRSRAGPKRDFKDPRSRRPTSTGDRHEQRDGKVADHEVGDAGELAGFGDDGHDG